MSALNTYHVESLRREHARNGRPYLEFLRVPAMSAGLYMLPARGEDSQSPHAEDEVYVVLNGRGQIRVGEEDRPVGQGSVVYVPARTEHRFHSIEAPLEILVLFAPAETAAATGAPLRA